MESSPLGVESMKTVLLMQAYESKKRENTRSEEAQRGKQLAKANQKGKGR